LNLSKWFGLSGQSVGFEVDAVARDDGVDLPAAESSDIGGVQLAQRTFGGGVYCEPSNV
jgi:hypothetical protein